MMKRVFKFNPAVVNQMVTFPIYKFELPQIDPDSVADRLKSILKDQIRRDRTTATHAGFHVTMTDILNRKSNNLFEDLLVAIEDKISEIEEDLSPHYKNRLVNIKPTVETFWGIMYNKGDEARWHQHQNIYTYQAVYYPEEGDDTPIVFKNDNGIDLEIKPTKGLLVVFGGKAMHMVPTITSDKPRLVFASNICFKERTKLI